MAIISISLNEEILSELDNLKSTMGFTGRSDTVRAGIRNFMADEKQKKTLDGNVHAILLVIHNNKYDNDVPHLKHDFEDIITTHLHSKIENEKCMELFVINGESTKVNTITKYFQTNKKMDVVKLIIV